MDQAREISEGGGKTEKKASRVKAKFWKFASLVSWFSKDIRYSKPFINTQKQHNYGIKGKQVYFFWKVFYRFDLNSQKLAEKFQESQYWRFGETQGSVHRFCFSWVISNKNRDHLVPIQTMKFPGDTILPSNLESLVTHTDIKIRRTGWKKNNFNLNIDKTTIIFFRREKLRIATMNKELSKSNRTQYLGLIIDKKVPIQLTHSQISDQNELICKIF